MALDTGSPPVGGGDLGMFYRIDRAGYRLVYVPGLLVHEEHRRDMAGFARQYFSWGDRAMASLRKNEDADPAIRDRQCAFPLRWIWAKLHALLRSLSGRGPLPPPFVLAEIGGGIAGYFGAYQRRKTRVTDRKSEYGK
jgi:hypothetical protein